MTPDEFREDIARQAVILLSTGQDMAAIIVHPRVLLSLRNKSVLDLGTDEQWRYDGLPVWRSYAIAGPLVVPTHVLKVLRDQKPTVNLFGDREPDLLFY